MDLESINALNISLQKYEGTVLLVTHDFDVIDEVATRIWHFEGGHIDDFKGAYGDYLLEAERKAAQAKSVTAGRGAGDAREAQKARPEKSSGAQTSRKR